MGSIGSTVRRAFGRYERPVAELYRGLFVDLDAFSRCIEGWTKPRSIVEIGCGEGALAERLVRHFPDARYLGIDIVPHVGRLYHGPLERVEFLQISSQQLASERASQFDLVVLADVMHHVEVSLRKPVLESARELLAPQGRLVLKDWVRKPTLMHAACYVADVYVGGDRNVRYMTLGEQRKLLEFIFGEGSIIGEASIPPWSHNHAFLVVNARQPRQDAPHRRDLRQ